MNNLPDTIEFRMPSLNDIKWKYGDNSISDEVMSAVFGPTPEKMLRIIRYSNPRCLLKRFSKKYFYLNQN